jgi:hypothetical protein
MVRGTHRRGTRLFWSLLLATVVMAVGTQGVVVAQDVTPIGEDVTEFGEGMTRFGEAADTLAGVQQVVSRSYLVSNNQVIASQVIAFVFRFDSDGNAHAAWETLDTTYERAEDRIEVAALGTATRAYSRAFSPYETWTEVLTQEGPYVYVVAVLSTSPDLDTVTLATDLIRTMLANQAGDGLGEFRTDGTSRGGLWDTLPSDDELPPGFVVDTDDQPYPLRAAEDAGMMDFGQVAGTQRAVWRAYSGIVGPSNPVRGGSCMHPSSSSIPRTTRQAP